MKDKFITTRVTSVREHPFNLNGEGGGVMDSWRNKLPLVNAKTNILSPKKP